MSEDGEKIAKKTPISATTKGQTTSSTSQVPNKRTGWNNRTGGGKKLVKINNRTGQFTYSQSSLMAPHVSAYSYEVPNKAV